MLALACSTDKPLFDIVRSAEALGTPCMMLSIEAIKGKTGLEIEAAFYLSARAFEEKSNISEKHSNEALLFLAREMNFASALRKIGAKDARAFVFVCKETLPLSHVKKALALTSAKKIVLSRMGKKKGAYFKAERAVEGMALARVKN